MPEVAVANGCCCGDGGGDPPDVEFSFPVYSWFESAGPERDSPEDDCCCCGGGGGGGGSGGRREDEGDPAAGAVCGSGALKNWVHRYESLTEYETPARMFVRFEGRKPGLQSGDVIRMYWQGYALAVCPLHEQVVDGEHQFVFEPVAKEENFDSTAFELEVVQDGQFYGFRAPKAHDRLLQTRHSAGTMCLLFLNGQVGDAESWEITRGNIESHWSRLAITLCPKTPKHFSLDVEIVRVGKYQPLTYAVRSTSCSASPKEMTQGSRTNGFTQVEILKNRVERLKGQVKADRLLIDEQQKQHERLKEQAVHQLCQKHQDRLKGKALAAWRACNSRKHFLQFQVDRRQAMRNWKIVSNAFSTWMTHGNQRTRLRKIMDSSVRQMSQLRMGQAYKTWQLLGKMDVQKSSKLMSLMWVLRRQRMAQCFLELKALALDFNSMTQQWNEHRVLSSSSWQRYCWQKEQLATMVQQALTRRDQRLMMRSFASWQKHMKGNETNTAKKAQLETLPLTRAFRVWRAGARQLRLESNLKHLATVQNCASCSGLVKTVSFVADDLYQQRVLISLLREGHKYIRERKERELLVTRFRQWQALRRKHRAFHEWKSATRAAAASRRTAEELRRRKDRELVHGAFHSWREFAADEQSKREAISRCEMSKKVAMLYFFEWFRRNVFRSWRGQRGRTNV